MLRERLHRNAWLYQRLRRLRSGAIRRMKGLTYVDPTAYIDLRSHISKDLRAGAYAYVGRGCRLGPGVSIGAYTMLAPQVTLVGQDHIFDLPGTPMIFAGRPAQKETSIGDDVWIGFASILNAGIVVGTGSIVAAGSVVTKDVPPFTIVAGVPATVIRRRFTRSEDEQRHVLMLQQRVKVGRFASPKTMIS